MVDLSVRKIVETIDAFERKLMDLLHSDGAWTHLPASSSPFHLIASCF